MRSGLSLARQWGRLVTVGFVFFPMLGWAQVDTLRSERVDSAGYTVGEIHLKGNKRTKPWILTRELTFEPGDRLTYFDSTTFFTSESNKIFNLGLFNQTKVYSTPTVDSTVRDVQVEVDEQWYVFPIPILDLADRNFNEWWQRGHRLDRLNWGMRVRHANFRGRAEELKLTFQQGFTQKYQIAYKIPYLNRQQQTGLGFEVSYADNKSVAYNTIDNYLEFEEGERVLRRRFWASMSLFRRPKFYTSQGLELGFYNSSIADTIAQLNPDYFLDGQTNQRYLRLTYGLSVDRRDIRYYALRGSVFNLTLDKRGLGVFGDVDQTLLYLGYARHFELTPRIFLASGVDAKLNVFPSEQPYFQIGALGYGEDFVRGYELSVIDGEHFFLHRTSLRWRMFRTVHENPLVPIEQFKTIPIAMYVKIYGDWGTAFDGTNRPGNAPLADRVLYGVGAGFDIVTYYNLVFRIEYSITDQGNSGLFLHTKTDI